MRYCDNIWLIVVYCLCRCTRHPSFVEQCHTYLGKTHIKLPSQIDCCVGVLQTPPIPLPSQPKQTHPIPIHIHHHPFIAQKYSSTTCGVLSTSWQNTMMIIRHMKMHHGSLDAQHGMSAMQHVHSIFGWSLSFIVDRYQCVEVGHVPMIP